MNITFTPISTSNPKHISVLYYNELLENHRWRWSDGKHNKSRVNDYFAFYFHKQKVIFHKITGAQTPEHKNPDWNYNGDQTRNILTLSPPLFAIEWNMWVNNLNGPQSRMSTYTTTALHKKRPLVYQYLQKNNQIQITNKY